MFCSALRTQLCMPKVSRCSHHCYHNIDVNLMLYEYSRFAGHPIFLTSFSFDLPKAFFQYSFFICILLPIISNILVCVILLTYSAITSGDKTCVTFFLAWRLAFHWHWIQCGLAWTSYAPAMNAAHCPCCVDPCCYVHSSLLHWPLPPLSVSSAYLFLLCHLGNVKYQN